jgi:hypothetical protein
VLTAEPLDLECLGEPPIGGGMGSNQGLEKLGFPWILSSESSLFNGLRAIFCGTFFMPVPGRQAVLAAPVGWLDRLSTPPAPSDGAMSPESTSEILCFNLSPVVRLFQNAAIMRWWRVSGKKLSVILSGWTVPRRNVFGTAQSGRSPPR